jgi:hypothetical protein
MGGGADTPNPIRIFYFMIVRKDKPFILVINERGLAQSGNIQPLFYIKELEAIIESCIKTLEIYQLSNFNDEIIFRENEKALEKEYKKLGGERRKMPETFIYLMKDEINGYHKIGRSKTPHKREKTLQSEKPSITLVYSCKANIDEESLLHKKYNEYRIRGEWFNLSEQQLEEIKSYLESKYPVGQ